MKKIINLILKLILVFFLIYIYARFIEPSILTVKNQSINSKYINSNSTKIKIIQFSDTHISEYYTLKDLLKTINKINELEPDIVVFTGDLIDNYKICMIDAKDISMALGLVNANIGKYCVYGNHDYGGGAQAAYKSIMKEAGFTLLINESVKLEEYNITITGLDDALFGQPDNKNIHSFIDEAYYNIILCHEPDIIDDIEGYDFDLAISGHSHGEQINLPFMHNIILPSLAKKYVAGIYELDTPREGKIYVNKGIGTSKIPLRFFAPPEITVFSFINKELKNN